MFVLPLIWAYPGKMDFRTLEPQFSPAKLPGLGDKKRSTKNCLEAGQQNHSEWVRLLIYKLSSEYNSAILKATKVVMASLELTGLTVPGITATSVERYQN